MKNRSVNHIRLTRIQKLIGKRMLESKLGKPCFYIESKADVTELMALRPMLKKTLGIKITSNAFLIRALALAVNQYPVMLSRPDNRINVGLAVNGPKGLVVPVIKGADKKSLARIAQEDKLLTEKARSNKLNLEDMEGETVALSNLGAYGIDSFIGIVPPPANTILAAGNVVRSIEPFEGGPAVRKLMMLSLAVDSRITDAFYAARFLDFITEQLENPQQLI